MKLNELVTIAPRYTRSVNLERDIGDESAVTGYVLTPVGIDFRACPKSCGGSAGATCLEHHRTVRYWQVSVRALPGEPA